MPPNYIVYRPDTPLRSQVVKVHLRMTPNNNLLQPVRCKQCVEKFDGRRIFTDSKLLQAQPLGALTNVGSECAGCRKEAIIGSDMDRVSTFMIEHHNLSVRMENRARQTHLANAGRTIAPHWPSTFAYYNFCRMHKTLRFTPAVAQWGLSIMFGRSKIC